MQTESRAATSNRIITYTHVIHYYCSASRMRRLAIERILAHTRIHLHLCKYRIEKIFGAKKNPKKLPTNPILSISRIHISNVRASRHFPFVVKCIHGSSGFCFHCTNVGCWYTMLSHMWDCGTRGVELAINRNRWFRLATSHEIKRQKFDARHQFFDCMS